MPNGSGNFFFCLSAEDDAGGPGPDGAPLTAALAVVLALHLSALATLAACARAMRAGVALEHPVFALVYREVLLLAAGEAAMSALLSARLLRLRCAWDFLALELALSKLTMQVHQVTWLQVTVLRYYLLVHLGGSGQPDLSRARRWSLALFWPVLAAATALSAAAWLGAARALGLPVESYHRHGLPLRAAGNLAFFLAANLPDFASIALYLAMKRHFGSNTVAPASINTCGGGADPSHDDQEAVLSILRTHAATSLVDYGLDVARTALAGVAWKGLLVSVSSLVTGFCIPLAVVVGGVTVVRETLFAAIPCRKPAS